MSTEHNGQDSRSTLERVHARWLGPIFVLVGVIAAIFAITAGVRSCSSAETSQYPADAKRSRQGVFTRIRKLVVARDLSDLCMTAPKVPQLSR